MYSVTHLYLQREAFIQSPAACSRVSTTSRLSAEPHLAFGLSQRMQQRFAKTSRLATSEPSGVVRASSSVWKTSRVSLARAPQRLPLSQRMQQRLAKMTSRLAISYPGQYQVRNAANPGKFTSCATETAESWVGIARAGAKKAQMMAVERRMVNSWSSETGIEVLYGPSRYFQHIYSHPLRAGGYVQAFRLSACAPVPTSHPNIIQQDRPWRVSGSCIDVGSSPKLALGHILPRIRKWAVECRRIR